MSRNFEAHRLTIFANMVSPRGNKETPHELTRVSRWHTELD